MGDESYAPQILTMRLGSGGWKSLIALAWLAIPSLCTGYDHSRPVPTDICEYRTVNYITHGLPQQCLRTSWTSQPVASVTSAAATSSESPSTNPTTTTTEEREEKQQQVDSKEEEPGKPGIIGQDSPEQEDLATSSFMSFEEWKEMMLRKSGQDPAAIKGHKSQKEPKAHRESGDGQADLDSLGDDGEISIDFGALSDKVSELTAAQSDRPTPEASVEVREEQVLLDDGKMQYYRSKDAGTTCKERFSYSSFDAGSTIKKTSPGAKNAKSILVENKDSYMLMECHTKNKFVIVELSDDILVDTVVLANFEFFSSMIRKFRVSVSDRYPVKLDKWIELGTFEARNSRDIQAFMIEHPQIYTKYIRIEFLTHYGNEYYCPVSLLRVHGTRMLDSWKEPDTIDEPEPSPEPVSQQEQEYQDVRQEQTETATRASESLPPVQTNNTVAAQESSQLPKHVGVSPWPVIMGNATLTDMCVVNSAVTDSPAPVTPLAEPVDGGASSSIAGRQAATPPPPFSTPSHANQTQVSPPATTATEHSPALSPSTSLASSSPVPPTESPANPKTSTSTTRANAKQQQPSHKGNFTEPSASIVKSPPLNPSSSATQAAPKVKTSMTSSAPASPTVQESFFKAVTKRLQHLESNTSLSMQYIEEQSRFLQEALQKMEKRQISRVDAFLDTLNKTVFTELRNVRAQYDQIWQSTVIALESQRDQSQRETVALSERLSLLADEVVFQKRMAILQSVLLLAALVLVIFSRGYYVNNPPVDMLGHQSRFSFQSHGYRDSMSAPALVDSPPRHLGDDLDPDADYSAPSPSPKRRGSVSSRRTLSQTASYNDKVLPLTPDSKSASEYGTREVTPAINVVDTETPFFYGCMTPSAPKTDDRQRQDGTLSSDGSEPPNSTESTPDRKWEEGRTSEDSESVQGPDILLGSPERDRTQHQAKILARRAGNSQSGSIRKPLPALPEDIPEDDEPSVSYEK